MAVVPRDLNQFITTEGAVWYIGFDLEEDDVMIFVDGSSLKELREGTINLIAGNASLRGYENGVGSNARFSRPTSLLQRENSTWIIADVDNHCLRKVEQKTQIVEDFLGVCTQMSNPPVVQQNGLVTMNKPYGLIVDKFNEKKIYISQILSVWSLNTENFEIVEVFQDYAHGHGDRQFTLMAWYRHYLLVTTEHTILRLNFSTGAGHPNNAHYTFNSHKIEWINSYQHYRNYPEGVNSFQAIEECGIEGVFAVADNRNSAILFIDFYYDFITPIIPIQANFMYYSPDIKSLYLGFEGFIGVLPSKFYYSI